MRARERPFRVKAYGDGFPVVIIPGLDGITAFFADITPELSRYFRVLVYQLPLLSEAKRAGEDYTFDYIAADLKDVMDEHGIEQAHLMGESFGGVVAQVFTLHYPKYVKKLVLISSAPHFDLSRRNRMLLPLLPLIPQWLFARVHVRDVCEPDDPSWARELFIREASWADHPSVVARARIVSRVDLRDRVSAIESPALLVVGGADRFTGEASRRMPGLLPDCRVAEIPGGGHLCHMTDPELFLDAALEFLGQ